MRRITWTSLALALALLAPPPALAAPSAPELVARTLEAQGTVSYQGVRTQQLTRQNLHLKATMRISHRDGGNYRVSVEEPQGLSGVHLWMDEKRANVFFPAENLLFRNDNPSGSNEAASTIFGLVSADPDLLLRNYTVRLLSEGEEPNQVVAMTPCYVLEVEPIRGFVTPGHRFWISRDSYQVMREDRTWGRGIAPYFQSYFETFVPQAQVETRVTLPRTRFSTVELQRDQKNSFVQFSSLEEAEKALKAKVDLPSYVPAGYRLYSLQFASFFGTRITLLHYTDGVNWMFVSYRPKPNMFLTLMAGAMALSLVDKMSSLSYQAPYNYSGVEKAGQLVYAYGDLYPEDLTKVVGSMTVQGK